MDIKTENKIKSIIHCIETGSPNERHDEITILHDGPHDIAQITLGDGLTEFGGDLKKCIEVYIAKEGTYAEQFKPYVDKIGKHPSLVGDKEFLDLLKKASKEDKKMVEAEDEVFDDLYWNPAKKWAKDHGFEPTPLSLLVIYDSYVQSGKAPFGFLRSEFPENVPSEGGNEKTWIRQYIKARLFWLSNHSRADVRKSAYRMRTYKKLAEDDNWDLTGEIETENGCVIPS